MRDRQRRPLESRVDEALPDIGHDLNHRQMELSGPEHGDRASNGRELGSRREGNTGSSKCIYWTRVRRMRSGSRTYQLPRKAAHNLQCDQAPTV